MSKKISCGLIIQSGNKFFCGKVTGGGYRWDIPKGVMDDNETPLETALRECKEETNIDITVYNGLIKDLGNISYMPGKDLHLFHVLLKQPFDLSLCKCSSLVEIEGRKPFPEICGYDWKNYDDFINSLGKNLKRVIENLDLVSLSPKSSKNKSNKHV